MLPPPSVPFPLRRRPPALVAPPLSSWSSSRPVAVSTRFPPCEQSLAVAGAGASLSSPRRPCRPRRACRPSFAVPVVVPVVVPSSPSLSCSPSCAGCPGCPVVLVIAVSTCGPPCEQWLTGLGAGAGSSWSSWFPLASSPGCGVVAVVVVPLPSSLLPVSTPRAVARGRGWGCCDGGGWSSSSLPLPRPSSSSDLKKVC